jgi:hypothetical protein
MTQSVVAVVILEVEFLLVQGIKLVFGLFLRKGNGKPTITI